VANGSLVFVLAPSSSPTHGLHDHDAARPRHDARHAHLAPQFGLLVSAYTLTAAVAALAVAFYTEPLRSPQNADLSLRGLRDLALLCGIAPAMARCWPRARSPAAFGGVAGATVHSIIGDAIPEQRRGAADRHDHVRVRAVSIVGVRSGLFLAAQFSWRAPFLCRRRLDAVLISHWKNSSPMRGHIFEGQSHRLWSR